LTDLANQPNRVGGYWVNSNDWFYFAGDTKALNDFLRRYAKLTETPLVLVIHPGKAPAERCVGELFAEPYDWKLDSMYPAFTRDKKWFQKADGGQWGRVAIVQAWLGGNIRLDELDVPANIEVRPGGEIEEFIEQHNKKKAERSEAPWGKAVEGVQCRLLPKKSTWKAGQTPQLQANLRNRGKSELSMELYPTSWEVQYDGVWYHATARFSGGVELLRLKPRDQKDGISLLLEDRFDWMSKEDSRRLVFRPGRHMLRAAFHLDADDGSGLRVVSNPVEVEILPATDEKPASKAEAPDRQQDVVLRGAAASCRDLCLDIDEDAKVEQIGGATSSRCLRLAKGKAPAARWKLTGTERGCLIQAQAGKLAGWYLDFDDDAQIEELGGATSSSNLLLTEQMVPGAYWKVTETDEGSLIQAQAGRFEGWYLDLDLLTKQRVKGAFWEFSPAQADSSMGEETRWGDPVRGVKMRLHAPRSRWAQGQTPELRVDFVNMNNERIDRLAFLKENWEVELDGRLYRVRTPDPGNRIDSPAFGPGAEQRDILVPLHEDFGWTDRSSLEFLPGKHTVRIHFTHNETVEVNDEYAEIHLVSNPVEIEIEDLAK
jgi:hypothetical protein